MTKQPPRARFVPPPERNPEPLPLPDTTLGCWGGSDAGGSNEPRERLPADPSYLQKQPTHSEWVERQRVEANRIFWLACFVVIGFMAWLVWLLSA